MAITPASLEKLKSGSISKVIESLGSKLKRVGREYVTHCVWHEDKNPSLTINDHRVAPPSRTGAKAPTAAAGRRVRLSERRRAGLIGRLSNPRVVLELRTGERGLEAGSASSPEVDADRLRRNGPEASDLTAPSEVSIQ